MILATLAFLASAAQPAAAQPPQAAPAPTQVWSHAPSGISMPRRIDWMELSQERDMTGRGLDTILQYGRGDNVVSVYVFRASYPHTHLWFDQSWSVIPPRFPLAGRTADARALRVDGVEAGLARAMPMQAGGATGLALLRSGEWLVKIRVTSTVRDAAWVDGVIDRIAASVSLPQPTANAPLPDACEDAPAMSGRQLQDGALVRLALSSAPGIAAEVRGRGGLADRPQDYCRLAGTPAFVTLLQPRRGPGWIALVGDSYIAATAFPIIGSDDRFGLALSTAISTRLAGVFEGEPAFAPAFQTAMPLLNGQAGLATVTEPDAQPST